MSGDPLKCGPTPSYALFMTTPLADFRGQKWTEQPEK